MKVTNLTSPRSGAKVANQFVVTDGSVEYFQSYDSVIAKRDNYVITVGKDWNYSNTTLRYFKQWLTEEWRWTSEEVDTLKKMLCKMSFGDEKYLTIGNVEYTIKYIEDL